MSGKIPITILGAAGLIGQRHVEHVNQNALTELHSIVDPTEEGKILGSRLDVPVYDSLDSLLASASRPSAAIIVTPSHLHVQQAEQLIQYGIHVLIEKPVCTSVDSGMDLLRASVLPGAGTILSGYHRRFNPYIVAMKELLDSGKLGRILAVQGTWAVRKPSSYFTDAPWRKQVGAGGVLLVNMSHEIDLFRYMFGDICRVYLELGPNTRGHDVDETGAATLRFFSGVVGTFIFSDAALSPFSFEGATGENPTLIPESGGNVYRILGTNGSVELPSLQRYHYAGSCDPDWTVSLVEDEAMSPKRNEQRYQYSAENAPFTRRLDHWVQVIRDGVTPICTARDGVMATVILEALQTSAEKGAPVNIELQDLALPASVLSP